ncbi:MAG: hypothetical protein IT450_20365 [Phycisphaerales bacterium]|nr:hypothetical protein [Phycisphaerales bacterium]
MSISFLTPEEEHELALRIARDSRAELERHQKEKGKHMQDAFSRGIQHSTILQSNLVAEASRHLRNSGKIFSNALFTIVAQKKMQMSKTQVNEAVEVTLQQLRHVAQRLINDLKANQAGSVALSLVNSAEQKLAAEAVDEANQVRILAAELQRQHASGEQNDSTGAGRIGNEIATDESHDPTGPSSYPIEFRRFVVGCVLLAIGVLFAVWGFSIGSLSDDRRRILLWVLPLASGFAATAFAGSLSVKARELVPGVLIAATGGFGVWLVTFFFLFPSR